MIAEELLRAGRLDDALKALQEQVRSQPSNATLRIFLFQLAVMGQWARAQNQLKVVGELDASALPMVRPTPPPSTAGLRRRCSPGA